MWSCSLRLCIISPAPSRFLLGIWSLCNPSTKGKKKKHVQINIVTCSRQLVLVQFNYAVTRVL